MKDRKENGDRISDIKLAAMLLGKTEQFVRMGLRYKVLKFGAAVKMGRKYTYTIYPAKFEEVTGIRFDKEKRDERNGQGG